MAQISSISNGEALSSVRTKLNDVITEINLLDPTDWVDYSATSTIVGWSSFTSKVIRYRIIGKQLFCCYYLAGTSNSTASSFTLPNNCVNISEVNTFHRYFNNGAAGTTLPTSIITSASNVVNLYTTFGGGGWTAAGTKIIIGEIFYEIA